MKRFDIYWANLDPTIGFEMKKVRPCVIVSPYEIHFLKTCIIAPLTSKIHGYPSRVSMILNGVHGEIALDQLRTVDTSRLMTKIGSLSVSTAKHVVEILLEMFG